MCKPNRSICKPTLRTPQHSARRTDLTIRTQRKKPPRAPAAHGHHLGYLPMGNHNQAASHGSTCCAFQNEETTLRKHAEEIKTTSALAAHGGVDARKTCDIPSCLHTQYVAVMLNLPLLSSRTWTLMPIARAIKIQEF